MARPAVGAGGAGRGVRGLQVILCLLMLSVRHAVKAQDDDDPSGSTPVPVTVIDSSKLVSTELFKASKLTRTYDVRTAGTDTSSTEPLTVPAFAGSRRFFSLSFQQDGSWMLVDNFFGNQQIGVSVKSARTPHKQTSQVSTAFTTSSDDFEQILPFLQEHSSLGSQLTASNIYFCSVGEYNDYDEDAEVGSHFQAILFGAILGNTVRVFHITNIARIDTEGVVMTLSNSIPFNVGSGTIVGTIETFEIPTFNTQFRRDAIDDFNCRSFTSTAPPLPAFNFCPFYISQSSGRWSRFPTQFPSTCIIRPVVFGTDALFAFCCYDVYQLGFTRLLVLQINQGFVFRDPKEIQLQQACQRAGRQQDFYNVCPPTTPSRFRPPQQAQSQGDASMTTMDGFTWDFNAVGFFIHWISGTARIDLRMESANPGSSDPAGAVVGGIALKDGSALVVAQITEGEFEILIFNGNTPVKITATDYNSEGIYNNGDIEIRQNPNIDGSGNILWTWYIIGVQNTDYTLWVASYQPSNADARPYMLILLSLDRAVYFGDLTMQGLLGNWDEDETNDLIPRNGGVADAVSTATSSELDILNKFAMTYAVSSEETIYPAGAGGPRSDDDLGKDKHVVRDCESMIAAFKLANPGSLDVCLDYKDCECEYVTDGEAAALEVLMLIQSVSNTTSALSTVLPTVNGSQLLEVRTADAFTTMYFAQGEEGVVLGSKDATLKAENLPPNATFNEETGVFSWTPDRSIREPANRVNNEVRITVFDSSGREGIALDVSILLCGTEFNKGSCNYEQALGDGSLSGRFVYVASMCDTGWVGDFCEIDFDGCQDDTCKNGTCIDSSPSEQVVTNLTYTCGECDEGFKLNNNTQCSDVNECAANPCDQDCKNAVGSFICICSEGYLVEGTNCTDIDECTLQLDNCDQECRNIDGSFECNCLSGYDLVNGTCEQDSSTLAACEQFPCNEKVSICILDTNTSNPMCQCKRGYQSSSENINVCEDVNECEDGSNECRPGSICQNEEGTYTCTCSDGSTTDTDQRGCTPCIGGKYGKECSESCNCATANCNATIGCEACGTGFFGVTCADVNECEASTSPCGNFTACENNVGSFRCPCIDKYELNTAEECVAIDQCAASSPCTHGKCYPIGTEYFCHCFNGYTGRHCDIDIDECATSSGLCLNGGNCTDGIATFQCECTDKYKGARCEIEIVPPTPPTIPAPTEPPVFDTFPGSFVVNCELPTGSDTGDLEDSFAEIIKNAAMAELEVTIVEVNITDVSEMDRTFTFSVRLSGGVNITNTDVLNAIGKSFDSTFGSSLELTCPDNVTEVEVNIDSLNVGGVTIGDGGIVKEAFNPLPVILGSVLGVLGLVLTAIIVAACARRVYNSRVIVRTSAGHPGWGRQPGGMRWLPRGVMDARNLANIRRRERPIDNPWSADLYELETNEMPWNAWRGADNAYYGRSVLRPGQIGARGAAFGAAGHAGRGRFFRGISSGNFARPLPPVPSQQNRPARPRLLRIDYSRPNFNMPNFNNGMRRISGWLSRGPWGSNRHTGAAMEPVYAATPTAVTSPMVLMNQGAQQGKQYHWQATGM